jgi:multidrug resistance efflux pump
MAEAEPTLWELMRVSRSMDSKLDNVVTKDMFQAESRRVDERLAEQGRDIADERTDRTRAIEQERASRKEEVGNVRNALDAFKKDVVENAEKTKANMRWLTSAILLPVALAVFALLTRGG